MLYFKIQLNHYGKADFDYFYFLSVREYRIEDMRYNIIDLNLSFHNDKVKF